jgi:hypothetical protein
MDILIFNLCNVSKRWFSLPSRFLFCGCGVCLTFFVGKKFFFRGGWAHGALWGEDLIRAYVYDGPTCSAFGLTCHVGYELRRTKAAQPADSHTHDLVPGRAPK